MQLMETLDVAMMSVVQHLVAYVVDPRTVVTHSIMAGLVCSMYRQGLGPRSLVAWSAVEELVVYVVWLLVPHSLGAVFAIWLCLNVYEFVLRRKFFLQTNAVVVSGESLARIKCDHYGGGESRAGGGSGSSIAKHIFNNYCFTKICIQLVKDSFCLYIFILLIVNIIFLYHR